MSLRVDDPVGPEEALLDRTRTELGAEGRDVPGPVLPVPFDVLQTVASRDVSIDIENQAAAVAELQQNDAALARRYDIFLDLVRESRGERRLNHARNRLTAVENVEDLREVFAEFPELESPEAQAMLAADVALAPDAETRHIARSFVALVERAVGGDYEMAWAQHEQAVLDLISGHVEPRFRSLMGELEAAEGDPARAVAIGDELLGLVAASGSSELEAEVCLRTAAGLYSIDGPGRDDRLERAVVLYERAEQLLDANAGPRQRAMLVDALLNLGAVYGSRLRGDPAANRQRAIDLERDVLGLMTIESDGKAWAMAQTNLGLGLMERASLRPPAEIDERDAEMEEAIGHLEQALRWRSFERDPLDWAYTQTVLGAACGRLVRDDRRVNIEQAIEHHKAAARGFQAAGNEFLRAHALHNLSSEELALAQLDETAPERRAALLRTAESHARESLEHRTLATAPVEAGRTWKQLGDVLMARGEADEAQFAYRRALEGLTPQIAPRDCRRLASQLASAASERDDWSAAADAWETASEAGIIAAESRAGSAGRFDELEENLNIFRWAAYALTRAGRPARAIEVLEAGRTRELSVWLGRETADLEQVRLLDRSLSERFLELRSALEAAEQQSRAGSPGPVVDMAAITEAYQRTIEDIRALPGLERFLRPMAFVDIAGAIPNGEALAYLVTAPAGSVVLVVHHGSHPGTGPHVIDAPTLTSRRALDALIQLDVDAQEVSGYFAAQADDQHDLDNAIADVSAVLAPALLQPLASHLSSTRVSTACLVPTGLLGLVPLHALTWDDSAGSRCLIDMFDVVVVPSAFARLACRRRAEKRSADVHLLSVGNPLPHSAPLPGAQLEAWVVADAMPATAARILVGTEATKAAVIEALPRATHAHLACHGMASVNPRGDGPPLAVRATALDSGLSLANNEVLSALEIIDLRLSSTRLVVASACETAINPGYETADEVLALATVFIGAGAAGVVASLWAVDDAATTLLMSRFYEALGHGAPPATALRSAQLWLRELTPTEAFEYMNSRPALDPRLIVVDDSTADCSVRPFSDPRMWAAFIFSGA